MVAAIEEVILRFGGSSSIREGSGGAREPVLTLHLYLVTAELQSLRWRRRRLSVLLFRARLRAASQPAGMMVGGRSCWRKDGSCVSHDREEQYQLRSHDRKDRLRQLEPLT
jgi:hypothetical protein